MNYFIKTILPIALVALLSVSCGSSGNSGSTASGGIGGTGISQGTITEFGSVWVNGVKFNTDNATFTVDDNSGTQNDLAIGMVINVGVKADGTTADTIEFEAEVEGPIAGTPDVNNNTLTVLGRTVIVDDNTKIERRNPDETITTGIAFSTLETNDMLEVSGLVFTDGSIQATHIRERADTTFGAGTEVELKGKITSLNESAKTFNIGTQQINYSAVTPGFTLANNLLVEVKGLLDGTTLNASEIQQEDAFGPGNNLKVEIEGLVTTFTSSASFSVNGQAVTTDSTTVFEDGAADDIAANVRLEVEGTITGGVLVAKKVQFRGNRIKIEANVDAGSITTSPNTVTLLGIPVRINTATEMDDKSSIKEPNLTFSDIQVGQRLEIRGYLTGTGSNRVVVATRVDREDDRSDVLLQAPVDLLANPDLTLLGVTVNTSSTLIFKDRNDNTLSADTFFNQAKAGDLVKAKGTLSGANIIAEEVEFEG